MRVYMMHKADRRSEADMPVSPQLVAQMGQLMEEMGRAGIVRAGEGLRPSSLGVRAVVRNGFQSVTNGPFVGDNELPAAFIIVRVPSLSEAADWATRYADIVGDVEIDIRPLTEMWDLGFGEKPADNPTTRYMLVPKADEAFEAGLVPTAEMVDRLTQLFDEMTIAGVLLHAERLTPSSNGVRLQYQSGKCRRTDGPFMETKELLGGFVLVDVPSMDELQSWNDRFAAIIGDVEIDIRPAVGLYEPAVSMLAR